MKKNRILKKIPKFNAFSHRQVRHHARHNYTPRKPHFTGFGNNKAHLTKEQAFVLYRQQRTKRFFQRVEEAGFIFTDEEKRELEIAVSKWDITAFSQFLKAYGLVQVFYDSNSSHIDEVVEIGDKDAMYSIIMEW